jgi:hypothetical protein
MCDLNTLMGGPSGPTNAEKGAQAQSSSMAQTLSSNYSQAFAGQTTALQGLNRQVMKFTTGATGRGFDPAEAAAKRAEIVNNTAAGERNAQQASQNQGAGQSFEGHGDSSGLARDAAVRQQIGGEIGAMGENAKSSALNNETAQDFQQGRANTKEAMTGFDALAGQYGSAAHSSMVGAQEANDSSFKEATQIHQEQDAASGGLGKLIMKGVGMAGDFFTGGMSGLAGSAAGASQPGAFLSGGFGKMFG